MSIIQAYAGITILLCIGIIQGSIADLLITKKYPSITRFRMADKHLSRYVRWHRFAFDMPGVFALKWTSLIAALASIALIFTGKSAWITLLLVLACQLLTFPRWRNFVGSDAPLQRAVLTVLIIYSAFPQNNRIALSGLTFLAIYASIIYFSTGLQKVRSTQWRKGEALLGFTSKFPFWKYRPLPGQVTVFAAWTTIFFELFFFIGLIFPDLAIGFLIAGLLFHGLLSVTAGINHFFWTFLSTYPAYWFISQGAIDFSRLIFF